MADLHDTLGAASAPAAGGGPSSTSTPPLFRFSATRAPNASLRPGAGRMSKMKAGAFGFRELREALNDGGGGSATGAGPSSTSTSSPQPRRPLTIADVPHDVLVSIFEAVGDLRWVRLTVPLVCKEWNELYLSESASPLHEIGVDLSKKEVERTEAEAAAREGRVRRDPVEGAPPRLPVVDASRILSWSRRRAGWVRKLHLYAGYSGNFEEFTAEDLGALVAVVGPSLAEISMWRGCGELCKRPFWRSLRTSVVSFGRLRSLVVEDIKSDLSESDVEPLGQLAGSLEVLVLKAQFNFGQQSEDLGLLRFPESLCALTELRRLTLDFHRQVSAIPAGISSLKKLEVLSLSGCGLFSLPKELGQLSGLTKLNIMNNRNMGTGLPAAEAFPAGLRKMKSLRELKLRSCCLRTVPSFILELKSLESLELGGNELSSMPKELAELSGLTKLEIGFNGNLGAQAFPAEFGKMKSLRHLDLHSCGLRTVPAFVRGLESLEVLDLAENDGLQIDAPLDFLVEGCPGLREVDFSKNRRLWTPESLAHLEDFEGMMFEAYPDAAVSYKDEDESESEGEDESEDETDSESDSDSETESESESESESDSEDDSDSEWETESDDE